MVCAVKKEKHTVGRGQGSGRKLMSEIWKSPTPAGKININK